MPELRSVLRPESSSTQVLKMKEMSRLARLRPGNLGNLGFLPLKVCNKIYAIVLADFDPPRELFSFDEVSFERHAENPVQATHSIHTAILQTSRDVYRETFDLMVKENRFVHIRSVGVTSLFLLRITSVPIVTANAKRARSFKGYVLDIGLTFPPHGPWLPGGSGPFEAMMLARDLKKLCGCLMDGCGFIPGFSSKLTMTLVLGPVVSHGHQPAQRTGYEDFESLNQYFSEKTQQELLQPFRCNMHGFRNVKVCGRVSDDIARSTMEDMTSSNNKWNNPDKVLAHFTTLKESGMQKFKKGDTSTAALDWRDAIIEIQNLQGGGFWSGLVQKGGYNFINQMADLCFRMLLDCAHVYICEMPRPFAAMQASVVLKEGVDIIKTGFWKQDFTWRPSNELLAKLHFRTARFLRLEGDHSFARRAMQQIDQALLLRPDDPVILRERHDLLAWISEADA